MSIFVIEEGLFLTACCPTDDFHVSNGAKMVPFAGYSMPLSYGSVGAGALRFPCHTIGFLYSLNASYVEQLPAITISAAPSVCSTSGTWSNRSTDPRPDSSSSFVHLSLQFPWPYCYRVP